MFYNGFTLLMQIIAGAIMYWVGYRLGRQRGEMEMYQRCRNADEVQREYFSQVSWNNSKPN